MIFYEWSLKPRKFLERGSIVCLSTMTLAENKGWHEGSNEWTLGTNSRGTSTLHG